MYTKQWNILYVSTNNWKIKFKNTICNIYKWNLKRKRSQTHRNSRKWLRLSQVQGRQGEAGQGSTLEDEYGLRM